MWPMAVGGRAASLFGTLGPASLDPRSQSPSQLRACQRRRELISRVPTCTTDQVRRGEGADQAGEYILFRMPLSRRLRKSGLPRDREVTLHPSARGRPHANRVGLPRTHACLGPKPILMYAIPDRLSLCWLPATCAGSVRRRAMPPLLLRHPSSP